ncbi:tetratricopeptide repeat protein [Anoxynatronum buryatiense]|uniref:Tetratricopeptide repeat protein n=1 Tax=Anoxynatronum buryatiense TaxID=489973 RepID=A0AA46AH75_9CLOT|nr:hypothetical protein [Anoxynatronum buryatiense]SMP37672.1 hypothetical protein SAMN06296020_1013 [Anoxynatronum buryatiense]
MGIIDDWALKTTEQLTFIQLRPGLVMGNEQFKVPPEGLYVPLLTDELAIRIQMNDENQIISIPAIIRGMLLLLGADPTFQYIETYRMFLRGFQEDLKTVVFESVKQLEKQKKLNEAAVILRGYLRCENVEKKAAMMLGGCYVRIAGSDQEVEPLLEKALMHEAYQLLEKCSEACQHEMLLHYYLGIYYYWQKSYMKAQEAWETALSLTTISKQKKHINQKLSQMAPLVTYEKGYNFILQGHSHEGIKLLKTLETIKDDWWNLFFFIALGYRQIGALDDAIMYYGKVINIRGFHQQTAIELSEIFYVKGELEKAILWMEETLLQHPDQPDLMCRMAVLTTEAGRYPEAREWIEKARKNGADPHLLAKAELLIP